MVRDDGIDAAEQLAAIGQAVITTDPQWTVLAWNRAAQDLYGWTADEAIGRDATSLIAPDVGPQVVDDVRAALRDRRPWSGESPVRRKDGTRFTALVTDAGIYRDGELIAVIGVSTNLGAALRPLLERSTDAALLLRSDGLLSYASPAVRQLFGWSAEQVIGAEITNLLHPDDRRALGEFLGTVVREPGAHPPVELRVRGAQGWVWVEAALTNLLDDPIVRGLVCNLRPSRRRAAHQEAETRARQLQDLLDTRVVIEQAKGFLAGRDHITVDQAFDQLRDHARRHRLTIRNVAKDVLDGTLPMPPPPNPATL